VGVKKNVNKKNVSTGNVIGKKCFSKKNEKIKIVREEM